MGFLDSFLHPEKGYNAAQDALNQYYGQAKGFYNEGQGYAAPYQQHGLEAHPGLSEAMRALLNPEELQNKWISGYQESPQAQQTQALAQQHGLNAASSMGLMGSTPALQAMQQGASNISLADRQQYIQDLMQKYQSGIGIGQNIYGTGANTAGQMLQNAMNMGRNAMTMGENTANMQYGAQNAPGDLLGRLLGGGVGLAGSIVGGPLSGLLSNTLGITPPPAPWSTTGGYH